MAMEQLPFQSDVFCSLKPPLTDVFFRIFPLKNIETSICLMIFLALNLHLFEDFQATFDLPGRAPACEHSESLVVRWLNMRS